LRGIFSMRESQNKKRMKKKKKEDSSGNDKYFN
jgi:hypothetical protein